MISLSVGVVVGIEVSQTGCRQGKELRVMVNCLGHFLSCPFFGRQMGELE